MLGELLEVVGIFQIFCSFNWYLFLCLYLFSNSKLEFNSPGWSVWTTSIFSVRHILQQVALHSSLLALAYLVVYGFWLSIRVHIYMSIVLFRAHIGGGWTMCCVCWSLVWWSPLRFCNIIVHHLVQSSQLFTLYIHLYWQTPLRSQFPPQFSSCNLLHNWFLREGVRTYCVLWLIVVLWYWAYSCS